MLTHFQVCEGLDIVSGAFLPKLKEFEMRKLNELMAYFDDAKGVPIDIGDFGERIREYGHFLKDVGRGFAPFMLGRGRDFWA